MPPNDGIAIGTITSAPRPVDVRIGTRARIVVAEVIYQAATDGTHQLRYTAGEDAKVIIATRKAADDATFLSGIKAQFGIS